MEWTKTGRWTRMALATAVLVGCSESHEPITGVEHCEQMLQIHCLARHCCTVPSLTSDVSPEGCAESIDFVRMLCARSNYDEDPGIAWNASRAEAEIEEQRRAAESCTLPDPNPLRSLSGLVEGLVEPGGSCAGPHAGLVCRPGSYCHLTMNVCLRYLEEGEACPRGTICAAGLFCPTTDRVCARPGEVGDPCEGSDEASDKECVAGLFCDRESLTCRPRIAIGEPCARWSETIDTRVRAIAAARGLDQAVPIAPQPEPPARADETPRGSTVIAPLAMRLPPWRATPRVTDPDVRWETGVLFDAPVPRRERARPGVLDLRDRALPRVPPRVRAGVGRPGRARTVWVRRGRAPVDRGRDTGRRRRRRCGGLPLVRPVLPAASAHSPCVLSVLPSHRRPPAVRRVTASHSCGAQLQ